MSTADAPDSITPSVAIFSPSRTTRSPTCSASTGTPLLAVGAEQGDVASTELGKRLQRGAGAALRARLEVAPHQDQDDDDRGDLEVDLAAAGARPGASSKSIRIDESPASPRKSAYNDHAQAARGTDRDEHINHRRGTVPCVDERGPVEGPAAPEHDRGRELERKAAASRTGAPAPSRAGARAGVSTARASSRKRSAAARSCSASAAVSSLGRAACSRGRLDRGDQLLRRDGGQVELDRGALGRIVDRSRDALELVQLLLDARRATRTSSPRSGARAARRSPRHVLRDGLDLAADLELEVEPVAAPAGEGYVEGELVLVRVRVDVGEVPSRTSTTRWPAAPVAPRFWSCRRRSAELRPLAVPVQQRHTGSAARVRARPVVTGEVDAERPPRPRSLKSAKTR